MSVGLCVLHYSHKEKKVMLEHTSIKERLAVKSLNCLPLSFVALINKAYRSDPKFLMFLCPSVNSG